MFKKTLSTKEAAEYVGIGQGKLLNMIRNGRGPVHYRLGYRTLRFTKKDLDRWADAQFKNTRRKIYLVEEALEEDEE